MKKYIIKNNKLPYPEYNWDMIGEEKEVAQILEQQEAQGLFGKPIRWVREKVWIEENVSTHPDEEADGSFGYDFYPDEKYDEADVIAREERSKSEETKETEFWVQLKPEYTIEIEDITEVVNKESRIVELKKLLAESDFRMTYDYFIDMTLANQQLWMNQRKSWRDELRGLV